MAEHEPPAKHAGIHGNPESSNHQALYTDSYNPKYWLSPVTGAKAYYTQE